ncbi:MAG: hypothetical protein ACHQ9S_04590 [Candidatus Binatia bacterium]
MKIAGVNVTVGGFQGQSNVDGVPTTEPAFLDLEAGQPDANGFTTVNIRSSSEFFFVDATSLAHFVICIKPLLSATPTAAGLLGCNGGKDISLSLDQNHHLGQVGVHQCSAGTVNQPCTVDADCDTSAGANDGKCTVFTAAQCTALQGHVEIPYAACSAGTVNQPCTVDTDCDTSAGANDGKCTQFPAKCTGGNVGAVCQTNADCTVGATPTPGSCGTPHGGVCNGPLVPGFGTGNTGPGELFIVPDPQGQLNGVPLYGMPVEIGFEAALPCGDEGPGMPSPFALTTGLSTSTITNANDDLGHTLSFQAQGQNFDCYNWQQSTRGRLVLSAPAIDQLVGSGFSDVATIFNFASQ